MRLQKATHRVGARTRAFSCSPASWPGPTTRSRGTSGSLSASRRSTVAPSNARSTGLRTPQIFRSSRWFAVSPPLFCCSARDLLGALVIVVAVPGRVLTTWILKELIERPRPSADLLDFTSQPPTFSFPAATRRRHSYSTGSSSTLRLSTFGTRSRELLSRLACVVLIIGAGVERIYVGHHWPSDILGGYWHGALIVAAAIAVHQLAPRVRSRSNFRPSSSFSRAAPTL